MQLKPGESLNLPDNLRDELSKSVGQIYSENSIYDLLKNKDVIAVGDETTLTMLRNGLMPRLSIFDLKTKRKIIGQDIINNFNHRLIVTNPQGKLSYYLINSIKIALNKKIPAIQVIGEEDLASLACISLANNGVIIIYGIPNMGLSIIEVNDEIKKLTNEILEKMVIENGD
ncbi:MAG: GTP-dependent dephospho-CoA kinase family protein [Thermoplasmata archaeon]